MPRYVFEWSVDSTDRHQTMTRYEQEREELFDAISFWHGAVMFARDAETRSFAQDRIAALRCKMTVLDYEYGKHSYTADVREVRAMQDDKDAEDLF